MILPEELRLMANHWRNVERAARNSAAEMREGGVAFVLASADLAAAHAASVADKLESRALELEQIREAS